MLRLRSNSGTGSTCRERQWDSGRWTRFISQLASLFGIGHSKSTINFSLEFFQVFTPASAHETTIHQKTEVTSLSQVLCVLADSGCPSAAADHYNPFIPKITFKYQIQDESQISFCKILKYK